MTSPNHDTTPGQRPASRSNPIIVTLLLCIAILLAVIAIILVVRPGRSNTSAPEQVSAQAPTAASGEPTTIETAAPSQTDAELLELMHGEVRRNADDSQAKGKVDAPVVMVVYSDFACPFCTKFAQEVEPELADLVDDGTLRVEWRDLAQITATSPLAAQGGIAAGNQGKFWEFHDAVYRAADPTDHPEYTEDSLVAFAQEAGVPDLEKFRADLKDAATVQAVEDAKQHAYSLGIQGTPFFIINDAYVNGYADAGYMRNTILNQAAAAR